MPHVLQCSARKRGAQTSRLWLGGLDSDFCSQGEPQDHRALAVIKSVKWGAAEGEERVVQTQTQATVPDHDLHLTERPQVGHGQRVQHQGSQKR